MSVKHSLPLDKVLSCVGEYEQKGSGPDTVTGIASLDKAQPGDLSFLGNPKYRQQVATSQASFLLLPKGFEEQPKDQQVYILVENPSLALAQVCRMIETVLRPRPQAGIHPSAVIAEGATISPQAHVGPLCQVESGAVIADGVILVGQNYIGHGSSIGRDSWLAPRAVVMEHCQLGERVVLQAGAVIGSDGFGFETRNGIHEKVPQIGGVTIENDVDIGANTTIDRARFDQTVVGAGSKIDNLVQIGHNVVTGRGCIIAAQTGISGSTRLDDYVVLGGQVGLAGHIHIGKGSKVAAQSGVPGNLAPGSFVRGTPSEPFFQEQKILVLRRRLPEFFKRLTALEEQIRTADSHKNERT